MAAERRVDCVLTREDCRRASSSSDMGIFGFWYYICKQLNFFAAR